VTDLTYLSLFSGIGGLDLGLDRAGWTCVGQVELDAWCRTVLDCHWPEVPKHDDVRTAPDWWAGLGRPAPDLVAGGFPCQPFSGAGLRKGVADERWGWPWMRDVVAAVRPRYVLIENVATLLRDAEAYSIVLDDLSTLGFDAEWEVVPASALGAPHGRERVFTVAYPAVDDVPGQGPFSGAPSGLWPEPRRGSSAEGAGTGGWLPEPAVDRVAHGVPIGLVRDELHALGNAVVPQVGELVGRLIRDHALAGAP
jgi:DNA (cytosine-5)-methyltransferase 1